MLMYKNAILRYNPRNYLTLSRNKVNRSIRDGILNSPKNDFAIYNNGITMLCREFRFTESTGRKGKGQIIIEAPQIVNGGQTAYVLSEIYKDESKRSLLEGKEVLLRVITLPGGWDEQEVREFISGISNATNLQSRVNNADRRSNDEVLVKIQQEIFEKFGYLLERKRGEFVEAMKDGYVDPRLVIKRGDLLRAYLAYRGSPSEARQSGEDKLFREERFKRIVGDGSGYAEMVFAYYLLSELREEEKKGGSTQAWGSGLRYGKMAIIAAGSCINSGWDDGAPSIDRMREIVKDVLTRLRKRWREFEKWVKEQKWNEDYYGEDGFDSDNYYKGRTVDGDVRKFFC